MAPRQAGRWGCTSNTAGGGRLAAPPSWASCERLSEIMAATSGRPPLWSMCQWLSTTASMPAGLSPRRRAFRRHTSPAGPASNLQAVVEAAVWGVLLNNGCSGDCRRWATLGPVLHTDLAPARQSPVPATLSKR